MTREISDKKNLEEAMAVKKSGFKTKVHASPHKEEIDEWIMVRRWSSKMIVNELKRLYPNEKHMSDRAIDNYRKKYLPAEFAKSGGTLTYPTELRDSIIRQFDAPMEGIKMWKKVLDALESMEKIVKKTGVVPKAYVDMLKIAAEWYTRICNEFKDVGLMKRLPQESSITFKDERGYDSQDAKETIKRISTLKREIRMLAELVEEDDKKDTGDEKAGTGKTESSGSTEKRRITKGSR
ncbi:MAG: hypothetical protein ACTSPI_16155 [Candidatus Heimdallarchaeaceae archaeon]